MEFSGFKGPSNYSLIKLQCKKKFVLGYVFGCVSFMPILGLPKEILAQKPASLHKYHYLNQDNWHYGWLLLLFFCFSQEASSLSIS